MRKRLAGLLIRSAHRIYRPRVTEMTFDAADLPKRLGPIIVSEGGMAGGSSSFGKRIV